MKAILLGVYSYGMAFIMQLRELSLDVDGQIHTGVDGTVEVEGASCVKGTYRTTIIAVIGFVDRWSSAFGSWF